MLARLAVASLLFVAAPSLASDLDPKLAAQIKHAQKKALQEVAKAHGNKKSSQMNPAERREVIREEASGQQAVLDQHGISGKDFARYTAKLSREDQKQVLDAERDLEAADGAAQATTPKPVEEVKVQHGFSNSKPVELEAREGAPPTVEHGLPDDGR